MHAIQRSRLEWPEASPCERNISFVALLSTVKYHVYVGRAETEREERNMTIESGADLIMTLIYAPGSTGKTGEGIRGITRLEKLVFLLLREGGFEKQTGGELVYEAYDYGPYSGAVIDILEMLKGEGLVEAQTAELESFKEIADGLVVTASRSSEARTKPKTVEIYTLSAKGKKVAEVLFRDLSKNESDAIVGVKKRFNQVTLNDLLKYVYDRYPKMIEKSKIMDQVLGLGSRPDLPAFEDAE